MSLPITLAVFALGTCALAETPRQLIDRGNAAYQEGNYEEALQWYHEASVDEPESPQIHFNRGAAHYRRGDYEAATDAFEQAALKSRLPGLSARAKYNLGNCAFQQAERQRDSDPQKAIELCRTSIRHFQEALELDPELTKAAENIEVARLYVKVLLDELQKKQEEEQQQQQRDNLAEKLKDLLRRQRDAAALNETLAQNTPPSVEPGEWTAAVTELAGDQTTLQQDTAEVFSEMEQMQQAHAAQSTPASPPAAIGADTNAVAKLEAATRHVGQAINHQGEAIKPLDNQMLDPARQHQVMAARKLEDALNELKEPQDQEQSGQQQAQNQEQQPGEDQEEHQEEQPQSQTDQKAGDESEADQEKQQQAARQIDDSAKDIIDEEKQRRRERPQPNSRTGYRPVEKDW